MDREKEKIRILGSIVRNPKLSKILGDGLEAPIGSTKRLRAKAILSIMEKTSPNKKRQEFSMPKRKDPIESIYEQMRSGKGGSPSVPRVLKRVPAPDKGVNFGYVKKETSGKGGGGGGIGEVTNPYSSGIKSPWHTSPGYTIADPATRGFAHAVGRRIEDITNLGRRLTSVAPMATGALSYLSAVPEYVGKNIPRFLSEKLGSYTPFKETTGAKMGTALFKDALGLSKWQEERGISTPQITMDATDQSGLENFSHRYQSDAKVAFMRSYNLTPGGSPVILPGNRHYLYLNKDMTFRIGSVGDNYQDNTKESRNNTMKLHAKKQGDETQAYTYKDKNGNVRHGIVGDDYYNHVTGKSESATPTSPTDPSGAQIPDLGVSSNPLAGTQFEGMWETLPQTVRESLMSTLSPGIFADITMADRNKLRELFPGVPEADLPYGAGLLGQVEALSKRLKENHGLDELYYRYEQLLRGGYTLEDDLIDYAGKRDTFIKSVDSMIEKVDKNIVYGSASPDAMAANKQYKDYLNVLKGRQTGRYIDLIGKSVNLYDAKMKGITDMYNLKYQEYRREIDLATNITVDRYNQMRDDLKYMWELVASGPDLAHTKAMMTLEELRAEQELIAIGLELGGNNQLMDVKRLGNIEDHVFEQYDTYKKRLKPGTSIDSVIQYGFGIGANFTEIATAIQNMISYSIGSGDPESIENAKRMISTFKNSPYKDEFSSEDGSFDFYQGLKGHARSLEEDVIKKELEKYKAEIAASLGKKDKNVEKNLKKITGMKDQYLKALLLILQENGADALRYQLEQPGMGDTASSIAHVIYSNF